MPLSNGATFAGFTIVRLLGSGSTGAVYLAEHPRMPRRVALKLLRADVSADPAFRDHFGRDVDLAATFDHPNIVRVIDRGESGRRLWLAMEYVDGRDAARWLRDRFAAGMPLGAVAMIVAGVADGLDYVHQRGVLHRHVKPTNILLAAPDSYDYRILLADFGTARLLDKFGGLASTAPLELVGYAAPEQLTNGGVDGRADQFGLAATAFHLLTGAPPFAHPGPAGFSGGHRNPARPTLADTHPDLAALDPVFARALAKDPAARFDTCRDFAGALAKPRAAISTAVPITSSPAPPAVPETSGEPTDPPTTRTVTPPILEAPPRSETMTAPDAPGEPSAAVTGTKTSVWRSTVVPAVLALVVVAVLTAGLYFSNGRPSSSPGPRPGQPAAAPSSAPAGAPPPVLPPPRVCGDLQAAAAGLPLRDQLAQLLMVGVTGADDARAVVANQHVGGVFIGSWTDVTMLKDGSLQTISRSAGPLPLAVSVDEEGGRVERLSNLIGSQPSPRVLAANDTVQQVHNIAFERGTKMKAYGITIDFAPVVDVTDEPDDAVIGDRSFGSDPEKVTKFAGAYAQGLRDAGLLPVLKHFPGHGHGSGDSHKGGVTTPPLADLQTNDLVPYRTLTAEGPVAVMVGHLQVPELTGSNPASLSDDAYALLRSGSYGGPPFNGPVFTDDLSSMGAINQHYTVAEAVLRALQAGADTALWITTDQVPAVLDRLQQAVNTNELSKQRVSDALQRVATAKGLSPDCRP